jgi:hypothetical protein
MPKINFYDLKKAVYEKACILIYMFDGELDIMLCFNNNNCIVCLDNNLRMNNEKIPISSIKEVHILCNHYKEEYNKILLDLLCVPYLKNVDIRCSNKEIYDKIVLFIPNHVNYSYFIKYI